MSKLNIGCGKDILPNCINHDLTKFAPGVDVAHDLNVFPWPWKANTFDEVIAKAVLEHLVPDLVQTLNEVHRILKPGGLVTLKLPHWRADIAHWDPTHRWFFSLRSFDQFDLRTKRGKEYAHYTKFHWHIIKIPGKKNPRLNNSQSSIWVVLKKVAQ